MIHWPKGKMMRASFIFNQKNGDVTKEYYRHLDSLGVHGQLGTALFRAIKRSRAAKSYRGRHHTAAAYDVKNWSMSEVCRILSENDMGLKWGWKRDDKTRGYEWVLYVELPTGQCSFHSPDRLKGPDFPGEYDGANLSMERILAYCDDVCDAVEVEVVSHAASFQ